MANTTFKTGSSLNTGETNDNRLIRSDGTDGSNIQGSGVTLDDLDAISGLTQADVDNIRVDGNTISSTDTNGNINLAPNGTGEVRTPNSVIIQGAKELRLNDSDNSNYLGFKSPSALSGDQTFTLPDGDGASGQALSTDGAGTLSWVDVASSGGINYITNYKNPADTTGWATYADAAGTEPVDGTGGSPTVTFTRNTSSPIRDSADFLFTKDAADRQGEGFSYDFTIDEADINKSLYISFDFSASANYVTDDVLIFVYDVTNATLTQISRSGNNTKFTGRFTSSDSTSYRLIGHVATTNASAYTIQLTNFIVGPDKLIDAPIITGWTSYTPTFEGLGTVTDLSAYYRRVDDVLEVIFTVSGGTHTATPATISFPTGYTYNANYVSSTDSTVIGKLGTSATPFGNVIAVSTGSMTKAYFIGSSSSINAGTNGNSWASGTTFSGQFSVPISDWEKSSAVLSTQELINETGVWRAYRASTAQTISSTSATDVVFNTLDFGNTGEFNTSTGTWTAPRFGKIQVNSEIRFGNTNNPEFFILAIEKNGTVHSRNLYNTSSSTPRIALSDIVDVNAGDTINISVQSTADTSYQVVSGSGEESFISISYIPDLTVYAKFDPIIAGHYTSNAGQTINNNTETTVIFEDLVSATTSILNTSTGIATVQTAGYYQINTTVSPDNLNVSAGNRSYVKIEKNTSTALAFHVVEYSAANATEGTSISLSTMSYFDVGDTFEVTYFQNSGSNDTLATADGAVSISFFKVSGS